MWAMHSEANLRRWLIAAWLLVLATAANAASAPAATAAVSASARDWWIGLLVMLVAVLALVAWLARRRSRNLSDTPTYSEGWQGIGGPSYAPGPVTVRLDPRTGN